MNLYGIASGVFWGPQKIATTGLSGQEFLGKQKSCECLLFFLYSFLFKKIVLNSKFEPISMNFPHVLCIPKIARFFNKNFKVRV